MTMQLDEAENDRVTNLSQELSDMNGFQEKLSNVNILYGILTKMAVEIEDLKAKVAQLESQVTPNWVDPIN